MKKAVKILALCATLLLALLVLISCQSDPSDPADDGAKDALGVWKSGYSLNKTYDGVAVTAPTADDYEASVSASDVTVEWFAGSQKLDEAPVDAGSYTVKLTANGASLEKSFTIAQKSLLEVKVSKTYDGSEKFMLAPSSAKGIVKGDTDVLIAGTATSADVGATLADAAVVDASGAPHKNYTVDPSDVVLRVSPKEIRLPSNTAVKTRAYDGTSIMTYEGREGDLSYVASFSVGTKSGHEFTPRTNAGENLSLDVDSSSVTVNTPNVTVTFEGKVKATIEKKLLRPLTVDVTAARISSTTTSLDLYLSPIHGVLAGDLVTATVTVSDANRTLWQTVSEATPALTLGVGAPTAGREQITLSSSTDAANYAIDSAATINVHTWAADRYTDGYSVHFQPQFLDVVIGQNPAGICIANIHYYLRIKLEANVTYQLGYTNITGDLIAVHQEGALSALDSTQVSTAALTIRTTEAGYYYIVVKPTSNGVAASMLSILKIAG